MNWPRVKIGEVAIINPRLPRDVDEAQQVSFVAMASVSEDGYLLGSEARVLSETRKGFTYFGKDDVLLAKITPCFENGKCLRPGQISSEIGFGSTEFHVIRPNSEKIDGRYLFYLVWSEQFRFLGEKAMSGAAGQKRVGADFLKEFEIPLPPLAEQKRIAAILDKVDAIRRKRQQVFQLADDFLRAVFLDMFGDPVTNPQRWRIASLLDYGSLKNGLNFEKGESGVSISCLGVGDFKSLEKIEGVRGLSIIDLNSFPADDYLLRDGDIVFVRSNGNKALVGRCLIVYPGESELTFSGFCIRYRIERNGLDVSYLNQLLRMPSVRGEMLKGGQGANIQNINQKALGELGLPVPPMHLQLKFSGVVRSYYKVVSKAFDAISGVDDLFGAVSNKAFSGRL